MSSNTFEAARPASVIDLRSDLLGPRPRAAAEAMRAALLRPSAMDHGEDPDEVALNDWLAAELGVEAVLLVPTCTLANQIAIRLHLPDGGRLASEPAAHVVTVEARATDLAGVGREPLASEEGHPSPSSVAAFLRGRREAALIWLENTHMLSAGSVMPAGWQAEIGAACRAAGARLHLDGSRLWNAAVAQDAPMSVMTAGCDTIAISLNKAVGAPLGSVLAGSRPLIAQALRWRDALGGNWRPIGGVAAAALAALQDWRARLTTDLQMTRSLAQRISNRLGPGALRPSPSNLIFLNRPGGDAAALVEALARQHVRAIPIGSSHVRLAIHSGVREAEVEVVAAAVAAAWDLTSTLSVG